MHELYELKDKLMKELETYGKQELTAGSLEVVDKLSHAIKNICKIMEASDVEDGQSMRDGYSMYYSRDGRSYARGRGNNARRDARGRYSRDGDYSRTDGVEELVENVRDAMRELPQNLQMDAQRFIQKLEQEM